MLCSSFVDLFSFMLGSLFCMSWCFWSMFSYMLLGSSSMSIGSSSMSLDSICMLLSSIMGSSSLSMCFNSSFMSLNLLCLSSMFSSFSLRSSLLGCWCFCCSRRFWSFLFSNSLRLCWSWGLYFFNLCRFCNFLFLLRCRWNRRRNILCFKGSWGLFLIRWLCSWLSQSFLKE